MRNLSRGFELLVLRRLPPGSFDRSFDQLAGLLIVNLVLWAGLDTLHAQADSRLMLDAFYVWACYLLMGLFGCALVARANGPEADTRAVLTPVLAVSPYLLLVFWLASDTPQVRGHPIIATALALFYLYLLSRQVLNAAYESVRMRTVVTAIALIVLTPVVLEALNFDTRLWITEDPQETEDVDDSSTAEPLLYDQPARIAAAVDHLTPEQGATPAVYFVGFAGHGAQSIFKREALFAQQVFADRFGSGNRSLELINDVEDRESFPLATVTGLQLTLKLLASRMDTERDVLVLTLTSHGSEEGLDVSNGSLPLLTLGPADLRQALDKSGIKWRVVIVSACYAGVFLDALKTDTTLVVTAADSEHSSFGCDDDRDLTYFGEAFLKDSLPATDSLEEAFGKASELIQQREDAEHMTHSNPQLHVGRLIRQKLAELEMRNRLGRRQSFTVKR